MEKEKTEDFDLTFLLQCQEVEIWNRDYVVKAKTKEEAIKKLHSGDFEECPYGETEHTSIRVKDVLILNKETKEYEEEK